MFQMKKLLGIAVVAGIVALGISSVASAQGSVTPTPVAPTSQTAPPQGMPPATPPDGIGPRGLHSEAALEAAAKALGMTTDELSTALSGGQTLADLAEEKGVDIADVKEAVEAAQVAETKTGITQAVTDGTLTQDKADWLNEGLDAGFWGPGVEGGMGFGMGPDMGGHGGRGGPHGAPPAGTAPTDSTAPSTTN